MAAVFTFTDFNVTGNADTDTVSVDIGEIKCGGVKFILHMIKPKSLPAAVPPSVASVRLGETVVWEFKRANFAGFSRLVSIVDGVAIALIGKQTGGVEQVILLSQIGQPEQDMLKVVTRKRQAAEALSLDPIFSKLEEAVIAADPTELKKAEVRKAAAEQAAAEKAAKAKENEEKQRERNLLSMQILARPRLKVRTTNGQKRSGYPVTAEEDFLQAVPLGTWLVLVESYEDGYAEGLKSVFVVDAPKRDGKPIKGKPRRRYAELDVDEIIVDHHEKPVSIGSAAIKVELRGETKFYEVDLYEERAQLESLRRFPLEADSFVGFMEGRRLHLFRLRKLDGKVRVDQVAFGTFETVGVTIEKGKAAA